MNYLQITIMPEVGLGTAARLPKGPGENDSKGFQGRGRGGGGRRGGRGAGDINVGAGPVAQVQTFEDSCHHYFFIDICMIQNLIEHWHEKR